MSLLLVILLSYDELGVALGSIKKKIADSNGLGTSQNSQHLHKYNNLLILAIRNWNEANYVKILK